MFHVEQFGEYYEKLKCSTPAPYNVPRGTFVLGWNILNKFSIIIIIAGFIQSIIGIFQFIVQHSLGLFWLKESIISSQTAGVAKIIFNENTFIRAYGLFPHPNIFGGFLVFSIILTLLYLKIFIPQAKQDPMPVSQIVPRPSRVDSPRFGEAGEQSFPRVEAGGTICNKLFGASKMFHVEHFSWNKKSFIANNLICTIYSTFVNLF
jgi:hypothetical protein